MSSSRKRAAWFLIFIIFVAFISLGSPDGLLDIANPRIRSTFDIGPDIFSLIFITGLIGYFTSSFFAGQLVARMGIGLLLSASCFMTGGALMGYAAAPAWGWFVLMGLFGGAGAGAIDTGINTYVATNYGPRLMCWLHASFGVGVTSGTWLMGLVVNSDHPWRWGYVIVGTLQIALALCFLVTRERWKQPHPDTDKPAQEHVRTPIGQTLRLPVVWFGIAMFFLYTGVEVTSGRWSSSLFQEGRHIRPETAALWVSAYWGMFTVGRVTAGFIGRWMTPLTFLRMSLGLAVLASVVLVLNPAHWTGGAAIGLMGFALAPIFPIMVSDTPGRVGLAHAPNTIGFQIGAAAIGGSAIPATTGVLAKISSINAMPVVLLVVTVSILVLNELIVRSSHVAEAAARLEADAVQGDR